MAHQWRTAWSAEHRMRRWLRQRLGGLRATRTAAPHRCGPKHAGSSPWPELHLTYTTGIALTTEFTLAAGSAW
jgi:hypothetical protein